MQISCSLLSSNNRLKCLKELNDTNIDYIHVDVMDGKFVKNKEYSINEILKINDISKKKLDIHLMVENPINYIPKLSLCNIEYITIHYEINKNIKELIDEIKSYGFKCGLSIKPNTSVDDIIPYLDSIDMILVMSVEPGYGGQAFLDNTFEKIKYLKEIINNKNLNVKIEVDGGINNTNIRQLKDLNVDIAVIGSYLTNDNDYDEKIKLIQSF